MTLANTLARVGAEVEGVCRVFAGGVRGARAQKATLLVDQLARLGAATLPLVAVATFLAGAVVALQSAAQLTRFGAPELVVDVLSVSMVRELGPLLAGLLFSARGAAGLASELGVLEWSGQIRAMRALGLDLDAVVVAPRVQAAVLSGLVLGCGAMLFGLGGGFALATGQLGIDPGHFWGRCGEAVTGGDIACGLTKSALFGALAGGLGCSFGLRDKRGAPTLGEHTMRAVVASSMAVLVTDHLASTAFTMAGL
jgi:phospholipid/cholesterol/gamma-HCH transport system permease protein